METLTRRNFIAGSTIAGLAAAAGLAGCAAPSTNLGDTGADGGDKAEKAVEHNPVSVEDVDIVVVGSGTAGTCATLRAAQAGANVVCLEKLSHLTGSSQYAEGAAGVNSRVQAERNITLNPTEIMGSIMDYQHYACSGPVVSKFLSTSGETIDWMSDAGIQWYDVQALGNSYQTWHIPAKADGSKALCGDMCAQLQEAAEKTGAQFRLETPMTGLVTNDSGAVTGVYAQADGQEIQINAKAVILASGGYANNPELFEKFTGVSFDKAYAYGDEGRDGDGIAFAMDLGAATHRPGCVMFHSGKLEDTLSFGELPNFVVCKQPSMRVNANGTRYFNEQVSMTDFSACGNVLTTSGQNFAIFDDDFITRIETKGPWLGLLALNALADEPFACREEIEAFEPIKKADTLEELGEMLGIDGQTLAATAQRFNGFCDTGKDDDFGLPEKYLFPVKTPPFYGAKIIPTYFTTVGGLEVDENMRVLTEDGYVIEGLYAAGGDAGSLYGACYDVSVCSGSQQGWAATSGRLAAEHACGA